MAKSTFSGPVKSLAGFISAGTNAVVSLTADTTLTVDDHAGKLLLLNDADGAFTLPSIVSTVPSDATDPNQPNNLGATFTFLVLTAATSVTIITDGTDKFVGGLYTGVDDATGKTFISGAANDIITMNGTTQGGLVGSVVVVHAVDTAKYVVEGTTLGSGTLVTPFSGS
jgi:hypothetical protein|tara:strand:- start:373 stop:879 length:507 start_codon:yes stop_codon:yes gene_type:complete